MLPNIWNTDLLTCWHAGLLACCSYHHLQPTLITTFSMLCSPPPDSSDHHLQPTLIYCVEGLWCINNKPLQGVGLTQMLPNIWNTDLLTCWHAGLLACCSYHHLQPTLITTFSMLCSPPPDSSDHHLQATLISIFSML